MLYFYSLDPELGLIYVRLTGWFPFTVQVYLNGHSWLGARHTLYASVLNVKLAARSLRCLQT